MQLWEGHCLNGAKTVRSSKAPPVLRVPDQSGEGQEHAEGQGHKADTGRGCRRAARHQLQELLSFLISGPEQDREQNKAGDLTGKRFPVSHSG